MVMTRFCKSSYIEDVYDAIGVPGCVTDVCIDSLAVVEKLRTVAWVPVKFINCVPIFDDRSNYSSASRITVHYHRMDLLVGKDIHGDEYGFVAVDDENTRNITSGLLTRINESRNTCFIVRVVPIECVQSFEKHIGREVKVFAILPDRFFDMERKAWVEFENFE